MCIYQSINNYLQTMSNVVSDGYYYINIYYNTLIISYLVYRNISYLVQYLLSFII